STPPRPRFQSRRCARRSAQLWATSASRRWTQALTAAQLVGSDQLVGVRAPRLMALGLFGLGEVVQTILVSANEQQIPHAVCPSVQVILGPPCGPTYSTNGLSRFRHCTLGIIWKCKPTPSIRMHFWLVLG